MRSHQNTYGRTNERGAEFPCTSKAPRTRKDFIKMDIKIRAATLAACVTAASAGSLVAIPAAYADANVETGHFSTKGECQSAGRAGLYSGTWTDYRCERVDEGGYPGGHDGPYVKK